MKISIRLLSAAGLLFASVAAHAVDDVYIFESIISVEHVADGTSLTGVIANSSDTISVVVPANTFMVGTRCASYYDVMLKEQGVFTLSVTVRTTTSDGPGGSPQTVIGLLKCSLTRNP